MQIRRRHAALMAGVGTLLSISMVRTQAAQPATSSDNILLGVRLLDTYRTVLQKFGQPGEIQVGAPIAPEPEAGAPGAGGFPGNEGFPGSGGMAGMPGGSGMPGSFGTPGSGGRGTGMYGGPASSGFPGGMGIPGSGGFPGSGLPGFGGPKSSGGFPSTPGTPGSFGTPGGSGTAGGSSTPNALPGTDGLPPIPGTGGAASQETVWWYKWPRQGIFVAFLFNKQGQVIQIQSHGYKTDPKVPTARTSKGVVLGSSMGTVLKNYGWSPEGDHSGEYVVMRYDTPGRVGNGHGKVAFQVLKNQVVGITLGFVK